ncbi:MAG TPA: zf-HC2 domain-containing protein [Nitrospira sp.]|nr:zf-HC2 domain-containing protein [Nitrospira sp.]
MNEPETLPADIHPEATLLPWYATGTLQEQEQRQVARHLEICETCRRELEELTHMKNQLAAWYGSQPESSPRLAQSVLARAADEASAGRPTDTIRESRLQRFDRWIGGLFVPRWVPTLAVTMIVGQLALLLWLTAPTPPSEEISTRSIGSPTSTFVVMFEEQASESQIRDVLRAIRGRIVDGPTSDDAYVIEAAGGSPSLAARTLKLLRARSDVIVKAEIYTP